MKAFRAWLQRRLGRQLVYGAVLLVAGTLAVGTVAGVAVTGWSAHQEADRDALRRAQQLADSLEASLADTRASLVALSRSSLVVNALTDASLLSETVRPLLAEHPQRSRYGSSLLLCDAFGRTLEASDAAGAATSCAGHPGFQQVLHSGEPSLRPGEGAHADALVWMLPVRLPLTGTHEGMVVVRQPLSALLKVSAGTAGRLGYAGLRVGDTVRAELPAAPHEPQGGRGGDRVVQPLALAALGAAAPLALAVEVAPQDAALPWGRIVGAYLLAALCLSGLAGAAAVLAARRVTAPYTALGRLAASPEGRDPRAWAAQADRPDEAGTLARCLQGLTAQLAEQIEAQQHARVSAERANRAKTEFLATMSHELRTPLNAVTGLAALALEDDDAQRPGHLRQLQRSAQRLRALVDDVLDLGRIESGRLELALEPCAVDELVAAVRDSTEPAAAAKGLPLDVAIEPGVPPVVRADPQRLVQVLTNLVGNAVKFTEHGRVRLRVSAAAEGLCFEVIDTGIGIPPAELAHVFDAFRQADATTSRRYGGSGLGLAICRRLVGLMDGRIEAHSTPGQGSRFVVTLPLVAVAAAAPAPAAGAQPAEAAVDLRAELGGRALLVVDDDEVNRMIARAMLEPMGVEVIEAEGGEAALSLLVADPARVGAVLMDCHMPSLDGYETTRRIRARPALADLPIIACTADVLTEDRLGSQAAGMDDYVSKPVDREQLMTALHRAVHGRRAVASTTS